MNNARSPHIVPPRMKAKPEGDKASMVREQARAGSSDWGRAVREEALHLGFGSKDDWTRSRRYATSRRKGSAEGEEEGRSPFDRLKQQPNKPLLLGADWADLGARTTELDCPWH